MPEKKQRILLVEDDASMRKLLEATFRRAGYDVLSAGDGLEAMKLFSEEKIDCLVTDAVMPGLSGFDLCRIVRVKNSSIGCVILSGLDKSNSEEAKDFFDAYVVKDENLMNSIVKVVRDVLAKSKQKTHE